MIKFVKILLSPLVPVYYLVITFRNYLFDKNIFKSVKVSSKVISIGNITVGGSGKTPATISVINHIKQAGIKPGVLSRGYGRNSKGYQLVYKGSGEIMPVDRCGDEMYLVVDECNIPGAVSERRVEGCRKFLNDVDIQAIILDDAFQHRWIDRDLDIIMFDQRFLLKNAIAHHHLLPLGVMREPFSAIDRADIIVINRKFSPKAELSEKLMERMKTKKVFYGYYETTGIFDVKTHKSYKIDEFKGQKSLVVCGIARPYSFIKLLEEHSIDVKNKILFNDHKDYSVKEVQAVRKAFYDTNSYSVLTTQKDAVKLTNYSKELDDIDIYYVKIELKIEEEDKFKKELMKIFEQQTNN